MTRAAWGPDSDALFAAIYTRVIVRLGHHRKDTNIAPGSFFDNFDVDGHVEVADVLDYQVPQVKDVTGNTILNEGYFDCGGAL